MKNFFALRACGERLFSARTKVRPISTHRRRELLCGLTMLAGILLVFHAESLSAITFPPTATVPKNAVNFLGLNQYVEVANPTDFNLTGPMTVEAWVNVSTFDKS